MKSFNVELKGFFKREITAKEMYIEILSLANFW